MTELVAGLLILIVGAAKRAVNARKGAGVR
jgi:hypothetical protein